MDEELDIFQDTTAEERAFSNPLAMAAEGTEEETGPVDYGMYGSELNWEDSVGVAQDHLGVTEEQWIALIQLKRKWQSGLKGVVTLLV